MKIPLWFLRINCLDCSGNYWMIFLEMCLEYLKQSSGSCPYFFFCSGIITGIPQEIFQKALQDSLKNAHGFARIPISLKFFGIFSREFSKKRCGIFTDLFYSSGNASGLPTEFPKDPQQHFRKNVSGIFVRIPEMFPEKSQKHFWNNLRVLFGGISEGFPIVS